MVAGGSDALPGSAVIRGDVRAGRADRDERGGRGAGDIRDLATYSQGRERLLREEPPDAEEPLGALEELELRRDLPVLKGRLQAVTEALGLSDPTPSAGRL